MVENSQANESLADQHTKDSAENGVLPHPSPGTKSATSSRASSGGKTLPGPRHFRTHTIDLPSHPNQKAVSLYL